jgi:glutamate-1-semialdehyde 2,1-aminomutase
MSYQDRLLRVIPGGAHTYSRGFDQHPSNAPQILHHGKGAYVFDVNGKRYLDYGMALRAVTVGYAEDEIDEAAYEQARMGNNLTRPSLIELDAAEIFTELIDSADMVKFTKNGSTSVTAAIKLARAHTDRDMIAVCADHPFFSYDDWFIGSTAVTKGIPQSTISLTERFVYNDIASLERLVQRFPEKIACVVLEPATSVCPAVGGTASDCCGEARCTRSAGMSGTNFLHQVEDLCRQHGIIFILDEMITGFRWHLKGAQHLYGVKPDLCAFGKGMANGYSVSCVAGRRELMQLGSIEEVGQERVFLLSTTHGAEMSGLGAFVKATELLQRERIVEHLWDYGSRLIELMNTLAAEYGIAYSFHVHGPACSPVYDTLDKRGVNSLPLRTLFAQEMVKHGVLMPWIALCWRHGTAELQLTEVALREAFRIYAQALDKGVDGYLEGPVIKPVFRRHN